MRMPLEGVRILDLTVLINGPLGTALLGDMGADVIRIEDLPGGDPARAHRLDGLPQPYPINYLVELQSRNKKSVGLNMRREGASEVIHRLVRNADVFVSNLRETTLKRWRLGYDELVEFNPSLIYALATGYGGQGPDADLPTQDYATMARSGLLSVIGEPGEPPPSMGMVAIGDHTGATMLAYGIMLALFHRERTGEGQKLYSSLFGGQIALQAMALQAYLITGEHPQKLSRRSMPNPLRNLYQAGDEKWICLGMGWSDRFWPAFCKAIGREEMVADDRFDGAALRAENSAALVSILDQVFATRPLAEWLSVMREHRLPTAPVNSYVELAQDPQAWENAYLTTVEHPIHGVLKEVGFPVQLTKTPGRVRTPAPEVGQHTEEVLVDIGGYTWDEIARLKEKEIII
ncbi:MAG: CoA transferase [Dehalococcoidia bacterium]